MKASDSAEIRVALQNAANDLLEGRAPGPLTAVRLIELAGVKRHRLTHDNPDINDAFQERARGINRNKPEIERLRHQLASERERFRELSLERDSLTVQLRNYATALVAVTDERERLIEQLRSTSDIAQLKRPPAART